MPRKPEPKFVVTYTDAKPDISEEEMKRLYENFIKLLVKISKQIMEEEEKKS
jgi:hypothetical protein